MRPNISVEKNYETEEEARAQQRAVQALMNEYKQWRIYIKWRPL
jgi:hypothetical protein